MNYGEFGGQYVPQELKIRLEEIEKEFYNAIAYALKIAKKYTKEDCIIVNLSGRGDKDVETILNLGG